MQAKRGPLVAAAQGEPWILRGSLSLSVLLATTSMVIGAQPSEEPGPPVPQAVVQKLLDGADQLLGGDKAEEALVAAMQALTTARAASDRAGEALANRAKARALEALNRPVEALGSWQESAEAWNRAADGPGQVEALCAQALLLIGERPEEAISLFGKARDRAQVEKRRPLAAIASLNRVVMRLLEMERLTEAQPLAELALDRAQSLASGSLLASDSLTALGRIAHMQGDLAAAKNYHERALAIREKEDIDSSNVAESMTHLGNLAGVQGDFDVARDYLQRAVAIQQTHAPGSPGVAGSLNNLGILAARQGDLATARDHFQRALEIRQIHSPGALASAECLNNLGIVERLRGDLATARDCFQRALEIRQKHSPGSVSVAYSLVSLGNVATQQGDFAGALDYLQRGLEILENGAPDSPEVAAALDSLGIVVMEQGDLTAARGHLQRGLEIKQKLSLGSMDIANSLGNLGIVAGRQGDHAIARDYHQRAFEIHERTAPGSLDSGMDLLNLGVVARKQGDFTVARDHLQRALKTLRRHSPGSLDVAEALWNLGEIARTTGDLRTGLSHLQEAWDITRSQRAAVTGDIAGQGFALSHTSVASSLVAAQLALDDAAAAFQTLEAGRAQALLQILAQRGLADRVTEPALWQSYLEAEADFQRAGQRLAETDTEENLAAYTRTRLEMEKRLAEVRLRVPGLQATPLTLENARAALAPGSIFLAFSVGEEQTILFVVPAGRDEPVQTHTITLGEKTLGRLVASMRHMIAAEGGARAVGGLVKGINPVTLDPLVEVSRNLFESLFPEGARAALRKARRVIVSPDGPLWELSFAALVTGEKRGRPRWLGLEKPLSYAASLSVLAFDRSRPRTGPTPNDVLVVGDPLITRPAPVSDDRKAGAETMEPVKSAEPRRPAKSTSAARDERRSLFKEGQPPPPLPWAREEALRVSRLYDVSPLLADAATESAVRERLPGASVVHLATHGYFHPNLAMSSGVLLASSEKEAPVGETTNDGALQAWEFGLGLPLRASLVVLSACDTGRGERVRGEGIVGLTRALIGSGARSVVATQWPVADQAAADLMVAFHTYLRQGMPKDEALRRAMTSVQQQGERARPPFAWAGFFLTGESDRPLETPLRGGR